MAKKRTVFVDVVVDDKGTTKKLAIDSKRLSDGLEKGQKNTKSFDRNLRGVIQTSQAGAVETLPLLLKVLLMVLFLHTPHLLLKYLQLVLHLDSYNLPVI